MSKGRRRKGKQNKSFGKKPEGPKTKPKGIDLGKIIPAEIDRPVMSKLPETAEDEKRIREENKSSGFTVLRPGVRVNPATQGGLPKAADVKGKPVGGINDDVIIRPVTYRTNKDGTVSTVIGKPSYEGKYNPGKPVNEYSNDEYWEDWWGDTTSWQGKKQKGKSASSSWSGRFNNYSGYSYGSYYGSAGDSRYRDEEKYRRILRSISRTANVVNFDASKVKNLKVQWGGDGRVNLIKDDTIYLSPDVIDKNRTKKGKWTEEELTDVLVGETLVQSTIKQTVNRLAESAIINTGDESVKMVAGNVWHTMETIVAEKAVLENYPGFAAYFSAYHEYYLDSDAKKSIERRIKDSFDDKKLKLRSRKKGDSLGAMLAIQWEILYPKDRLKLPPEVRREVNEALKAINKAEKPQARAAAALEIGQKFKKTWPYFDELVIPGVGMSIKKYGQQVDNTVDAAAELMEERQSLEDGPDPVTSNGDNWSGGTGVHKIVASPGNQNTYRKVVNGLVPQINALKSKLKVRNEEPDIYEHGLRRGHLDDGSLFKLAFADHPTLQDPKMFEEKTVVSRPDVAFGILVDESGSMSGHKIKSARDIAITLSEALKPIDGVELCVFGHTGQGRWHGRGSGYDESERMHIHEYYTPDNPAIENLIRIQSFSQNLDGYAIAHVARKMHKWYAHCGQRMLFLVSDGQPAGHGYGGADSYDHIYSVCRNARAAGTKVFGIGIENAYDQTTGKRMFGANNFVVLNNIKDSMFVMSNFMTAIIRKACAL